MKTITLIEATIERNGLYAFNDSFNPNVVNIVKKSITGRSNGLVMRFSLKTGNLIMDGTTHRVYVAYNGIDLNDYIPQLLTLKVNVN